MLQEHETPTAMVDAPQTHAQWTQQDIDPENSPPAPQSSKFDESMPDGTLPDKGERGAYKGTIANLKALFAYYGITCQYDNISKNQNLSFSGNESDHDLTESSNYALLSSLLALNSMPQSATGLLPSLMKSNTVNPVLAFIEKNPYKAIGIDYFRIVADSLNRLQNLHFGKK